MLSIQRGTLHFEVVESFGVPSIYLSHQSYFFFGVDQSRLEAALNATRKTTNKINNVTKPAANKGRLVDASFPVFSQTL
jgi:hypothetical protein